MSVDHGKILEEIEFVISEMNKRYEKLMLEAEDCKSPEVLRRWLSEADGINTCIGMVSVMQSRIQKIIEAAK